MTRRAQNESNEPKPTMTPAARRSRARIAALHKVGMGLADTSAARAGWLRRFQLQADPNGELPPDVRDARARALMKAEMVRLNGLRYGHVRRTPSEPPAVAA